MRDFLLKLTVLTPIAYAVSVLVPEEKDYFYSLGALLVALSCFWVGAMAELIVKARCTFRPNIFGKITLSVVSTIVLVGFWENWQFSAFFLTCGILLAFIVTKLSPR